MASSVNPFKLLSKYTSVGSEKVQRKVSMRKAYNLWASGPFVHYPGLCFLVSFVVKENGGYWETTW